MEIRYSPPGIFHDQYPYNNFYGEHARPDHEFVHTVPYITLLVHLGIYAVHSQQTMNFWQLHDESMRVQMEYS